MIITSITTQDLPPVRSAGHSVLIRASILLLTVHVREVGCEFLWIIYTSPSLFPPLASEKLSSSKLVPGAENSWNCWDILHKVTTPWATQKPLEVCFTIILGNSQASQVDVKFTHHIGTSFHLLSTLSDNSTLLANLWVSRSPTFIPSPGSCLWVLEPH